MSFRNSKLFSIVTRLCVTLLLFAWAPNSYADQLSAPTGAASSLMNGANIANPLSIAEIGKGTQNQDQGQQMQNMAQMAMGAMQIASGLLGMLAAAGMGDKSGQNSQNASGMSGLGGDPLNYPGGAGTSPTPGSKNPGDTTGQSTATPSDIGSSGKTASINASDLRSGTVGAALDRIEKNYGIPRDQFVDALKSGADPKDLLAHAPKNAPSMDMLNKISDGLAANNSAGKDASRLLASLNQGGGLAGTAASDAATEVKVAAGAKAGAAATSPEDGEGDASALVSPEVRAALAAKAAQARADQDMKDMSGWNIFQLVHNRYKKLEVMLYGRVERTNPNPTDGIKTQ